MLVSVSNFSAAMHDLVSWRGNRIGLDTETTGLSWSTTDRVIGVSVWCPKFQYYFPFRHPNINLTSEQVKALVTELSLHYIVAFNNKFDIHSLRHDGMKWSAKQENAHLLSHLADENEDSFELKALSAKHLGPDSIVESQKLDLLLDERKLKKGELYKLEASEVADYAIGDARLAYQLADFQWKRIKSWQLMRIACEIADYERITYNMEERGLLLDMDVVQDLERRAEPALAEELDTLERHFGRPVNPKSPKQVTTLLGLPDSKDETLELSKHPMAAVVRRARKWRTLRSNYCTPYRRFLSPDGALRPNYNLGGTVAGRPSCTAPNLQAVAKSDEVYRIKDCFVARPGYTFISADYSQAELRLAAHYTGDKNLAAVFAAGGDVHGTMAKQLGIERDFAKRINFGIVYGLGAAGLSKQLHISTKKAQALLNTWHRGFPKFKKTRYDTVDMATKSGYIRMWTGRVRRFDGIEKSSPYHKAFSSLIQGGIAEVLRHALQRLDRMGGDVYPVLQVYDQVLFEVPEDGVMEVAPEIKRIMEDFPFSTKLKVDMSHGPTWGKQEKIKEVAV